mgnify:FL=1
MSEEITRQIRVYGIVQGVGFRYHATYKASLLGLTGWVRNLEDGSVEMEVQGDYRDVEMYIFRIKQGDYFIRVDEAEVTDMKVKEESCFQIK